MLSLSKFREAGSAGWNECAVLKQEGKKENEGKNYRDFLSFVLTVVTAWQQTTHASGLTKQEVDLWKTEGSFCLNLWLVYLRNTGEWPGQAKHPLSE